MDQLIVYVDDAAHALGVIQPLLSASPSAEPRQWILLACAPRVTHHVSKWVTHSARESWRGKWSDKLFGQLLPLFQRHGQAVVTVTSKGNLTAQTEQLMRLHGQARVIDARRPKVVDREPFAARRPAPGAGWLGSWLTLMGAGLLIE